MAGRLDRSLEPRLAGDEGDELDLGAGEVDRRRRAEEAGHGRAGLHDVEQRGAVDEHVVDGRHLGVVVDAQGRAGVSLGVEVDDEHLQTGLGHRCRDVDGGRRLADATLLVGDREDPRHGRLGERAAGQLDASTSVIGQVAGQRGVVTGVGNGGREGVPIACRRRLGPCQQGRPRQFVHSVVPSLGGRRFMLKHGLWGPLSTSLSTGMEPSTGVSRDVRTVVSTGVEGPYQPAREHPPHPKSRPARPRRPDCSSGGTDD